MLRQGSMRRASIPSAAFGRSPSARSLVAPLARSGSSHTLLRPASPSTPPPQNTTPSLSSAHSLASPPPLRTQSSTSSFFSSRRAADDASESRTELAQAVHSHQTLLRQTARDVEKERGASRRSHREDSVNVSGSTHHLGFRGSGSAAQGHSPQPSSGPAGDDSDTSVLGELGGSVRAPAHGNSVNSAQLHFHGHAPGHAQGSNGHSFPSHRREASLSRMQSLTQLSKEM
jgi:hypothetical protein